MFNSEKISAELKKRNWSDYKLACEANIAGSTLNDLLNKKSTNPRLNTLLRIAEALKMPIDYFFERGINSSLFGIDNEIIKNLPINDNNYIKVFDGNKVNSLMKRRNISVYRLAQKIEMSQSSLSEIIKNTNTNPRVNTLFKISEELDVPISMFFKNERLEDVNQESTDIEKTFPVENKQVTHLETIESALHKMNKEEHEKAYNILKIIFEKHF